MKNLAVIDIPSQGEPNADQVEHLMKMIYSLRPGQYSVKIKNITKLSRRSQNGERLLCDILADHIGQGEDEYRLDGEGVHRMIKERIGFYRDVEIGGEKYRIYKSQADMTQEDNSRMIDGIYALGEFLNVNLPKLDREKAVRT